MENIIELKSELEWREKNPFYVGNDGMPSLVLITLGLIPALIYKPIRIKYLKNKIKVLERKNI